MSYIQIVRTPDMGMDEYERVRKELGPESGAGNTSHRVGVVDGALVTVDEWETRAHADRFAAERLFPAFERAGVRPGPTAEVTAFEAAGS